MKRLVLFGPLVLVAVLLLVPAAAQGQAQTLRLDQSQTIYDTNNIGDFAGETFVAQTFTAGVTGTLTQTEGH